MSEPTWYAVIDTEGHIEYSTPCDGYPDWARDNCHQHIKDFGDSDPVEAAKLKVRPIYSEGPAATGALTAEREQLRAELGALKCDITSLLDIGVQNERMRKALAMWVEISDKMDADVFDIARTMEEWDAAEAEARAIISGQPAPAGFDFIAHCRRAMEFSLRTFGPGPRTAGVLDHIRKEMREVEAAPHDLEEWVDIWMLALDGCWRSGHTPEQIVAQIQAKQAKNEARKWPDWRTADRGKAIEHDRSEDQPTARLATLPKAEREDG